MWICYVFTHILPLSVLQDPQKKYVFEYMCIDLRLGLWILGVSRIFSRIFSELVGSVATFSAVLMTAVTLSRSRCTLSCEKWTRGGLDVEELSGWQGLDLTFVRTAIIVPAYFCSADSLGILSAGVLPTGDASLPYI